MPPSDPSSPSTLVPLTIKTALPEVLCDLSSLPRPIGRSWQLIKQGRSFAWVRRPVRILPPSSSSWSTGSGALAR